MTQWQVKHADALAEPADVLICSANLFLNLSGGVGGEILRRYGPEMQQHLHRLLTEQGRKHAEQGEVICSPGFGRLRMPEFASGLQPVTQHAFPPVERVTLCLPRAEDAQWVARALSSKPHP